MLPSFERGFEAPENGGKDADTTHSAHGYMATILHAPLVLGISPDTLSIIVKDTELSHSTILQ
jgi:hypothetical protein